jgi:hypothetical protein
MFIFWHHLNLGSKNLSRSVAFDSPHSLYSVSSNTGLERKGAWGPYRSGSSSGGRSVRTGSSLSGSGALIRCPISFSHGITSR